MTAPRKPLWLLILLLVLPFSGVWIIVLHGPFVVALVLILLPIPIRIGWRFANPR
jgi:hypothetical protein